MSFPEFIALDNLLHDDEEYVGPTPIEVFYQVDGSSAGDGMLGIEVPGLTLSLRLRSAEYQPKLRAFVQNYVDGLSNSGAAWFLFRNRSTYNVKEAQRKSQQIS